MRTLHSKLGWPLRLTTHLEAELRTHFHEAWINGYESLISQMTNDAKDRHLLAAAVHCKAHFVVTFNLRHFTPNDLEPWGLLAIHPQEFLIEIFRDQQEIVAAKLKQQATERGRSLSQLLNILRQTVPGFVRAVEQAWE